jgi:hypothetical protein
VIYAWVALQAGEFSANFAGSVASCLSSPTSTNASFTITQNSSIIGLIEFSVGQKNGVFSVTGNSTSSIAIEANDIFEITVNSSDPSISNIFFTFSGVLT